MTYNKLNTLLLSGRTVKNRFRRRIANNTYVWRMPDASIAIRLHNTDILKFSANGAIVYRTGGWRTVTTKQRLNHFGPSHISIYQDKHNWYIRNHNLAETEPFFEGFTTATNSIAQ